MLLLLSKHHTSLSIAVTILCSCSMALAYFKCSHVTTTKNNTWLISPTEETNSNSPSPVPFPVPLCSCTAPDGFSGMLWCYTTHRERERVPSGGWVRSRTEQWLDSTSWGLARAKEHNTGQWNHSLEGTSIEQPQTLCLGSCFCCLKHLECSVVLVLLLSHLGSQPSHV